MFACLLRKSLERAEQYPGPKQVSTGPGTPGWTGFAATQRVLIRGVPIAKSAPFATTFPTLTAVSLLLTCGAAVYSRASVFLCPSSLLLSMSSYSPLRPHCGILGRYAKTPRTASG